MSLSSRKQVKFDFDPNRYPRSSPSWDTTNAEYGSFDYRRRTPLVPDALSSVYRRLDAGQPGAAAQRTVDEGLGGFDQRRSTYVDEISEVAVRNFTRTSQVHAAYDGVEKCATGCGPYAASNTATVKNATIGQVAMATEAPRRQHKHPLAEDYVRSCCPGLHSSMAALQ